MSSSDSDMDIDSDSDYSSDDDIVVNGDNYEFIIQKPGSLFSNSAENVFNIKHCSRCLNLINKIIGRNESNKIKPEDIIIEYTGPSNTIRQKQDNSLDIDTWIETSPLFSKSEKSKLLNFLCDPNNDSPSTKEKYGDSRHILTANRYDIFSNKYDHMDYNPELDDTNVYYNGRDLQNRVTSWNNIKMGDVFRPKNIAKEINDFLGIGDSINKITEDYLQNYPYDLKKKDDHYSYLPYKKIISKSWKKWNLENPTRHINKRPIAEWYDNYYTLADWLYDNKKLPINLKTKLYLRLRALGLINKNPEFESIMEVPYDLNLSNDIMRNKERVLKERDNILPNLGSNIEANIMGFVTGADQNRAERILEQRDNVPSRISRATRTGLPKDDLQMEIDEPIRATASRATRTGLPKDDLQMEIDEPVLSETASRGKTQRETTENNDEPSLKKSRKGGRKSRRKSRKSRRKSKSRKSKSRKSKKQI